MAEIVATYFINAAQAAGQPVSGSDALKATTICIMEDDDGNVHVAGISTPDTTDDAERRAAALAVTSAMVAGSEQQPQEPEVEVEPEADPEPEPVADEAPAPAKRKAK